ncbi:UDP-2,3-diacylglucosamine pyrophosphatase LpxH [Fodinibius salinus]|uniref:UDP-2,3-diacylglucosamine pyrophosphatase LpxH n=1 Tax=Fodinibius salinus TaxID=860790 RepID=A0A5D3YQ07_9BACT|nr:UDP-2,3-diacylglucosamine diphosphatase [Fodinibius salinus]TYP95063.1 UDP-2,3-diacylglucosamine pyrophosphatase LpxH [Fodinibius salinus]
MDTSSLSQPLLFISDIHLGGFSDDKNAKIESELLQLLKYCRQNDIRIIIAGDFFDYWMAYPDAVPQLGKKVLNHFREYNTSVGVTPFITGNHDHWTRDYLSQQGFEVVHNSITCSINSKKLMILHGDGLADTNLELPYPPLHRFLHHPTFVQWYQKLLPPRMGITIMKYFARFTRFIDSVDDDKKAQTLNNWAKKTLKESDIDIILCGHDHIPRTKHFTFGTYINLGTFCAHQTLALYDDDKLSLMRWNPQSQSLNHFE